MPVNDNTKLSVKHYRNLIYQEIDKDNRASSIGQKLDKFNIGEIKVSVNNTRNTATTTATNKSTKNINPSSKKPDNSGIKNTTSMNTKSTILRESKLSNNHYNNKTCSNSKKHSITSNSSVDNSSHHYTTIGNANNQGARSVSRRKGISLCSK